MKSRIKLFTFLFITILMPSLAVAEGFKAGFVNAIELLDKAPQTTSAKEKVEREFKSRDNDLVNKQKGLRRQEEKLKRDGSTMASSARQKLEADIARIRRDLKRDLDDFREDFSLARNRELANVQKHIYDAIVKLAKKEKFDLIVGDSVIYASEKIDVTQKVLKILREEFKKNAGK